MTVHPTHTEFDAMLEEVLGQRLPGRPKQEPFVQSEVQNYQLGSRLRYGKATWHYCQAGPVGHSHVGRGTGSLVVPTTIAAGVATGIYRAEVAGSYEVVIRDATHGENYWANGKIEIWTSLGSDPATEPQHRVIKSSTASNGTTVTLTLYYPLTSVVAVGTGGEICRSVYAQVDDMTAHAHLGFMTVVGIPLMVVTAEYFHWVQTWGICTINAGGEANMGETDRIREVFWHRDGTMIAASDAFYVDGCQRAGYLIPDTHPGGVGESQTVVMLQMDP